MIKTVLKNWYWFVIVAFFFGAGAVFIIFGEGSYLAIHDNLDLFIPQYQMMKDTGTFWSHGVNVPFLGGISRDTLPAEFSLYTMLYMILPSYAAYIAGYFLKIIIAMLSCYLLAKEFLKERYKDYQVLTILLGFAYGILNMFPNFGIPFASIPLVIYILKRIYSEEGTKIRVLWYIALFCYPLLSYFSYFGLFILAYLVVAVIWISLRDKKISWSLIIGIVVLSVGYMLCEYRLFGQMLFGEEETIRSTMVEGSFTGKEILMQIWSVWKEGMFHAESVHTWFVLPLCAIYFAILNITYIRNKNYKGIFHDLYNLLAMILVFNGLIYGLYYLENFRNIVEKICPPLTGWQFNRTVFFSPFVWYASFFLVLKRLYDLQQVWWRRFANLLAIVSILIIIMSGTRYNDLYKTCYLKACEIIKGKESDQLSYAEFYSTALFEKAKKDIHYQGEWSVAYGFYPAVLEYNEIATLDGYLGFYSQEYKDNFRKIIEPALEKMPESQIYYDEWGARVNLYSGTYSSVILSTKVLKVTEDYLAINTEAFAALEGKYIFSGIPITNYEEVDFELIGTYIEDTSPYTLYVYELRNR